MNTKQQAPHREGEAYSNAERTERIVKRHGHWVLRTREGRPMGPFRDHTTAIFASNNLVEFLRLAPQQLRHKLLSSLNECDNRFATLS